MIMVMWLGVWGGLVIASPIVMYELWAFVAPGLHDHEKRAIKPVLYGGVLFFLTGAFVSYRYLAPMTIDFFVWLDLSLTSLGRRLATEPELQAKVDDWVMRAAGHVVDHYRGGWLRFVEEQFVSAEPKHVAVHGRHASELPVLGRGDQDGGQVAPSLAALRSRARSRKIK